MVYGYINIDAGILSGTPVFNGTAVPIKNLFDYIEGGDDLSEFLDDFPSVTKEAAIAVLEMAKNTVTQETLRLTPDTTGISPSLSEVVS